MASRVKLTAVLSLLIAVVQLVGVGAVSSSSSGRAATEYYCCCAGECHCTADCCRHAPAEADAGDSGAPRIGAGTPIVEAPRSCGTWTGTLQRSPEAPKAVAASTHRRAFVQPEVFYRQGMEHERLEPSQGALRSSSPRAPPGSVDVG